MTKLRFFSIGAANREVARLEQLAGIPPVIGDQPRLRSFQKANARILELEAQLKHAGKYAPPEKGEKAPASIDAVFGAGTYQNISARASVTPTTPPPSVTIATHTPPPTAIHWDVESLSVMIDTVIGHGTARSICAAPLMLNQSGEATVDRKHSVYTPQETQEKIDGKLKAALAVQHAEQTGPAALTKLKQFCMANKLSVPGLSYAGLRSGGYQPVVSSGDLPEAQKRVTSFCAILAGDENAGAFDQSPCAKSARKLVASRAGQNHFEVGMKLRPVTTK